MAWTKRSAKREIESLMDDVQTVAKTGRASAEFITWFIRANTVLEEVFGGASKILIMFRALKFHNTGGFVIQAWDIQEAIEEKHEQAFIDDLNRSVGVFQAALDALERNSIASVYQGKNTPKESSTLIRVVALAERKLRKVLREPPRREREVQDAFENLLIGADIPYKREHPHITYSSKEYIPDFSFDRLDMALDIKLCARDAREKEIIAEMNDDIMAYKTKFGNIAFVIYDVGMIRDVDRFTAEFANRDDILIAVVKH